MQNEICILGSLNMVQDAEYLCQLISKARNLREEKKDKNYKITVLVYGNCSEKSLSILKETVPDKITGIHAENASFLHESFFISPVMGYLRENKPFLIIAKAGMLDKSLTAYVAARLELGLTADCTNIKWDDEGEDIIFTRTACGSQMMADIKCKNENGKICTVRKNVFESEHLKADTATKAILIKADSQKISGKIEMTERLKSTKQVEVSNPNCVIIAGRGVGNVENVKLVKQMAEELNVGYGVTRAVVESGWENEEYKIGQSGKTISTKVCIFLGVSGAMQHMIGIKNADVSVAVNNDKNADIFDYVDYKIIDNVENIIPIIIEKLKRKECRYSDM